MHLAQHIVQLVAPGLDITTVLVFLLVLLACVVMKRPSDIPPGPQAFPVVGNLPSLAVKDRLGRFQQLRKTYGDIFGLYFGRELFVFINGYDLIHEALAKKARYFSARPESTFLKMIRLEPSILNANGTMWKEQRAKANESLMGKEFSHNILNIETRIMIEVSSLVDKLSRSVDIDDTEHLFHFSISNVIFGIMFGERAVENSEKGQTLQRFVKFVADCGRKFAYKTVITCCLPLIQYIPFDVIGRRTFTHDMDMCRGFFRKLVNNAMEQTPDKIRPAFIEIQMAAIEDNTTNKRNNSFTLPRLYITIGELVAAGTESTSTTLQWLILYLILNPDLQTRLHACIDSVVGRHNPPSLRVRKQLPLVEATIMEVLRLSTPAPHGVPHSATNDVYLHGHRIPKGTTVMVCFYSTGKDPKVWRNPDTFDPDRFIGADGALKTPKEFIPFGIGRRSCLGETLAKMELFLFTTTLLQKFEFHVPAGQPRPSTVGILANAYTPRPYTISILTR